jgi:hypothetical protein
MAELDRMRVELDQLRTALEEKCEEREALGAEIANLRMGKKAAEAEIQYLKELIMVCFRVNPPKFRFRHPRISPSSDFAFFGFRLLRISPSSDFAFLEFRFPRISPSSDFPFLGFRLPRFRFRLPRFRFRLP